MKTITIPAEEYRALIQLAFEQTRHIEATDTSATGSVYGIEYADKLTAKAAQAFAAQTGEHPFSSVDCRP